MPGQEFDKVKGENLLWEKPLTNPAAGVPARVDISTLDEISDLADGDYLIIHDVSQSGTNKNKRISKTNAFKNIGNGGGGGSVVDYQITDGGNLTAHVWATGEGITLTKAASGDFLFTIPDGVRPRAINFNVPNAEFPGSKEIYIKFKYLGSGLTINQSPLTTTFPTVHYLSGDGQASRGNNESEIRTGVHGSLKIFSSLAASGECELHLTNAQPFSNMIFRLIFSVH